MGDVEIAKEYMNEKYKNIPRNTNLLLIKESHKLLSDIYFELNDFENAFKHITLSKDIGDIILIPLQQMELIDMEIQRETRMNSQMLRIKEENIFWLRSFI